MEPLLGAYQQPLTDLAPSVQRLATTLDPAEVEALVTLIDRLPQLVTHLDEDILPVLSLGAHAVHIPRPRRRGSLLAATGPSQGCANGAKAGSHCPQKPCISAKSRSWCRAKCDISPTAADEWMPPGLSCVTTACVRATSRISAGLARTPSGTERMAAPFFVEPGTMAARSSSALLELSSNVCNPRE